MTDFRSPTGRFYDWSAIIAEAKKRPGVEVRLLPNSPVRVAKTINERTHPDLRREDGELRAAIEHRYTDGSGTKMGDIYIRWTYNKDPTTHERTTPAHA